MSGSLVVLPRRGCHFCQIGRQCRKGEVYAVLARNSLSSQGILQSHIRSGGFLRVAIRILLSGLSLLEEEIWHLVLRHLIPLMDKHAVTFSEGKKEKGLYVLGHVHEAFIIAQNRSSDIQRVDYRVLLPLYMLVVNRWRELIGGLTDKSTGGGESIISDILLNEALMDQDIFLHLVSSPVWDGVFESHFFPVMRSVEDEQFAMVPFIAKRFGKATRTILSAWQKDEANLEVTTKAFLAKLQEEAWKMKENEVRARHELERSMEMERRWRTRELCSLWRNLTQERGIWRPYSELDPSATPTRPWKLDRAENSLRMRRRLAVNWEFDDHDSAAAKRDKTYKIQSSRAGSPKMVRSNTNSSLSGTLKRSGSVPMAGPGDGGDLLSQMNLTDSAAFILDDELDMAEEEWNVLNEDDLQGMSSTIGLDGLGLEGGQRLIFSTECDMILLMTPVKGRLELTATHLIFTADIKSTTADLCEAEREAVITLMTDNRAWLKERAWPLEDLTDCYLRRYMLRRSALELFFVDKTNHLFNFRGTGKAASKERQKFLKCLVNCKPGRLKTVDLKSTPQDIAKRSNMTDRWIKREISNFEYLMWLNTVSGRTYNDLTQYPVFPWVLRDFSSDSLDLGDPSVYRDLSKPIGAIDDNRLQQFLERYHSFEDPTGRIKKFHYGTHYSSAASVLYYLLRLEPLTSLHISLQSGKFDHPDRQFHSMQSCWKSVSTGAGDVKELIPEFFYMPEFLLNENDFDLGVKQTGEVLGDVILPPWAKTVDDFIRIHREALESDYVSSHLNEWIDLIWGYKQTGDEAIKANNVFYYLTYEGAINIDAIEDPVERRSIEDQINNFGQTPSQLFKKPHPRRSPAVKANNSHLFTNPQDYRSYIIETPRGPEIQFIAACGDGRGDGSAGGADKSRSSAAGGAASEGRIITVDKSLHFRSHKWRSPLDGSLSCDMDRSPLITRELPLDPASSLQLHSNLFAVTKDGRHLFAGGSWDCSFKVIQLENPQGPSTTARTVETIYGHRDIVTCIAISADENIVATGSRDTTVLTWELESTAQAVGVKKLRPKVFCGHDEWVTDVALDTEHGIVASGSTDGTVILHTLYDAGYLRSLRPCPEKPEEVLSIRRVLITQNACIVVYSEVTPRENTVTVAPQTGAKELYPDTPPSGSESTHMSPTQRRTSMVPALGGVCYLHVFSVNGRLMQSRMFPTRSKDVKCSSDGEHLVIADDRGGISLLSLHSLQVLHRFDVSITITGAWISHDQRHFFFGRKDGRLLLLEHDKRVARSDSFSSR
ncbi:uncharacterized protein EV422DRAFT_305900 [Fimicolochytrium jonesii]|uniref:uncharacterized protein n=1 Tax=Fimicolochytrium jonesii TaxID=1396493 RepID=UPI0022FECC86|nr:uncharacterized protein EV422DRAFT_305900 [Fimicolochytrium jonesii]KAI8824082.1 hypothetical protein EV422DRAFT_305900 [Fimicolochytrium jonesii]